MELGGTGHRAPFVLSLFRIPADPLRTWVENTVAIKLMCKHNGSALSGASGQWGSWRR